MRRLFITLLTVIVAASGFVMFSQTNRDLLKERQENVKLSKKELNEKASKAARNEAKNLKKQGWQVAPGALPIEKQLDRSYSMQYQYDYDGSPMFIMAEGMSTGGNYDSAKMQALELAKQNLAGQIQSEVCALVESSIANRQLEQGEASSIAKTVMASKNKISQNLGRIVPVMETYRVVNGNSREVLVRISYSMKQAKSIANKTIIADLEQEGNDLHNRLNKILND